MMNYFSNNYKFLTYPLDNDGSQGLRNAQIGAIHSIGSFFTLNPKRTAIIVMPTGAGKTAVLMMAPYLLSKDKVLIVTPSVLVRGQIVDDYRNLSTLSKARVFKPEMKKPVVYEMTSKFSDQMIAELEKADVIVATPSCALSLSSTEWAKTTISLVEVDEAHHTPAITWQQILINLKDATHILYTATPFRLDKKEIQGDIVFNYPLSLAYRDGIFGEIQFVPVLDCEDKDVQIAKKAEMIFLADRELGFEHYLMVRTDKKENAKKLEQIYQDNTQLLLKRIDNSMSNARVKGIIQELKDRKLDGIICVDMLGEGFDFPNLKIAAVHVPHKSLASTLQFIGRFARTNASRIGTAKFIAVEDDDLEIENEHLYASDAIWQDLIINMSENRNQKEQNDRQYYKAYQSSADEKEESIISLHAIMPNCHDRIYRVHKFDIDADFPDNIKIGNRVFRNKEDNTIIGVGLDYVSPLWMTAEGKINKIYSLFIIHYQQKYNLLHIYSQQHTEAVYKTLVERFCGEKYEKVPRSEIHRVLGNLSDYEFFNSGMVNRYNESGESYRIMAGSDVSSIIDPSTGRIYSPGHAFCKATDSSEGNPRPVTIGYSSASKVWSSEYKSISDYIKWVEKIGQKICDENIKVKTNTNFDYMPQAEKLVKYPDNLFFANYSDRTYSAPPTVRSHTRSGISESLIDFTLSIVSHTESQIVFSIAHDNGMKMQFSCDLQGRYSSDEKDLYLAFGRQENSIIDYFNDFPLSIKTVNDDVIEGFEISKGCNEVMTFDKSTISPVDWDSYGTDIHIEVHEESKGPKDAKASIQETVKKILLKDSNNQYVIYDHGSGEIADFVTVQATEQQTIIYLYHVKGMGAVNYNSSVDDVYEVAGQAVKSLEWLTNKGKLIVKIRNRHDSGHCKMERGDYQECIKTIRNTTRQMVAYIAIVQPALSCTIEMPPKIQQVLASASEYIKRAGIVKKLIILGSK